MGHPTIYQPGLVTRKSIYQPVFINPSKQSIAGSCLFGFQRTQANGSWCVPVENASFYSTGHPKHSHCWTRAGVKRGHPENTGGPVFLFLFFPKRNKRDSPPKKNNNNSNSAAPNSMPSCQAKPARGEVTGWKLEAEDGLEPWR